MSLTFAAYATTGDLLEEITDGPRVNLNIGNAAAVLRAGPGRPWPGRPANRVGAQPHPGLPRLKVRPPRRHAPHPPPRLAHPLGKPGRGEVRPAKANGYRVRLGRPPLLRITVAYPHRHARSTEDATLV